MSRQRVAALTRRLLSQEPYRLGYRLLPLVVRTSHQTRSHQPLCNARRIADRLTPNWRAATVGLTPAFIAALTAFTLAIGRSATLSSARWPADGCFCRGGLERSDRCTAPAAEAAPVPRLCSSTASAFASRCTSVSGRLLSAAERSAGRIVRFTGTDAAPERVACHWASCSARRS